MGSDMVLVPFFSIWWISSELACLFIIWTSIFCSYLFGFYLLLCIIYTDLLSTFFQFLSIWQPLPLRRLTEGLKATKRSDDTDIYKLFSNVMCIHPPKVIWVTAYANTTDWTYWFPFHYLCFSKFLPKLYETHC